MRVRPPRIYPPSVLRNVGRGRIGPLPVTPFQMQNPVDPRYQLPVHRGAMNPIPSQPINYQPQPGPFNIQQTQVPNQLYHPQVGSLGGDMQGFEGRLPQLQASDGGPSGDMQSVQLQELMQQLAHARAAGQLIVDRNPRVGQPGTAALQKAQQGIQNWRDRVQLMAHHLAPGETLPRARQQLTQFTVNNGGAIGPAEQALNHFNNVANAHVAATRLTRMMGQTRMGPASRGSSSGYGQLGRAI